MRCLAWSYPLLAKTEEAGSSLLSSTAAMMKNIHHYDQNLEKHFLSHRQI
jgi:hypothetical protein